MSDLESVCAAIADGRPPDWAVVESTASGHDVRLLRQLKALSPAIRPLELTRAHVASRSRLRVRGWLWPLFVLASLRVVVAIVGAATGFADVSGSAPFSQKLYLVHVFVYGIAGAVLLYGSNREHRAAWLGTFYLLVASCFSDGLIPRYSSLFGSPVAALFTILRFVRPEAFIAFAFWQFLSEFPEVSAGVPPRRITRLLVIAGGVAGCVLLFGDSVASLLPGETPAVVRRVLSSRQYQTSHYWTVPFLLGLPVLPMMMWKTRFARRDERRRVRMFSAALGIGLAPIVLLTAAGKIYHPFYTWVLANSGSLAFLVFPFLLSIPLTTAYAVLVHRVLDVRMVMRRALQHAMARYTLVALSSLPVIVFAAYVSRHSDRTIAQLLADRLTGVLAGTAIAGLLLLGVRRRLMSIVDLALFREHHDAARVLARFADSSRTARSPRGIAAALMKEMEAALHPESASVLVSTRDDRPFAPLAGGARPLPRGSALAVLLATSREPLTIDFERADSFARLLPGSDLEWLVDGAYRLLLPLSDSADALIGVVALGGKQSELEYSREDVLVLRALTTSAAAAIALHDQKDSPLPETSQGERTDESDRDVAAECDVCGRVALESEAVCKCGGRLRESPLPRELLGKFRIDRRVGSGGMGVVYRALDLALDRVVAIKTLPRLSSAAALRMRREARAMAAVGHPGLALIYGAESWRGTPLLVVEFLEGGTLADRLRLGPLAEGDAIDLVMQVASALEAMHRAGILHRDIKPSNIGFTAAGQPKLLDFGLARLIEGDDAQDERLQTTDRRPAEAAPDPPVSTTLTASQHLVGTPLYLPPEALSGASPGPGFDLWSLAMVLYESIAGSNPMRSKSIEETLEQVHACRVPSIRTLRSDVSTPLVQFLEHALCKDPRRRPESASSFRASLGRIVRSEP